MNESAKNASESRGRLPVCTDEPRETAPRCVTGPSRRSLQHYDYLARAISVLKAADTCPGLRNCDSNRRRTVLMELGRIQDDAILVSLAEMIEKWKPTATTAIKMIRVVRLGDTKRRRNTRGRRWAYDVGDLSSWGRGGS
jgi:hypothetical protein